VLCYSARTPMPRPKGSADLLEDRRRRALALVDSGCSLNEAARRIGCGASSVMRWYQARRRGGEQALCVGFSPGRPPKLRPKQLQRLIRLLLKGPMARGYRTNLWTTARIALLIDEEFGVDYHPRPVPFSAEWASKLLSISHLMRVGEHLSLKLSAPGGSSSRIIISAKCSTIR
jgi:transposase